MYIKVNTNAKLAESSAANGYLIAHFSLPAIATCPNANACKIGCYATQGNYRYPSVQRSYQSNLELTRNLEEFKQVMAVESDWLERKAKKLGLRPALRIHTSGDFYSPEYYSAWVDLTEQHSNIHFYAYTKMIDQSMNRVKPFNLCLIFSEGGTEDALIQEYHRHARVFESQAQLIAAGYDDASNDDTVAFLSKTGKIGLIYHGAARRAWTTAS